MPSFRVIHIVSTVPPYAWPPRHVSSLSPSVVFLMSATIYEVQVHSRSRWLFWYPVMWCRIRLSPICVACSFCAQSRFCARPGHRANISRKRCRAPSTSIYKQNRLYDHLNYANLSFNRKYQFHFVRFVSHCVILAVLYKGFWILQAFIKLFPVVLSIPWTALFSARCGFFFPRESSVGLQLCCKRIDSGRTLDMQPVSLVFGTCFI